MDEPQGDKLLEKLANDDNRAMSYFCNHTSFIDFSLTEMFDKEQYWKGEHAEMEDGVFSSNEQTDVLLSLDKKITQLTTLKDRLVKNRNEYRNIVDTYAYSKFRNIDALTLASDCRRGKFLAREADFLVKEIKHVLSL